MRRISSFSCRWMLLKCHIIYTAEVIRSVENARVCSNIRTMAKTPDATNFNLKPAPRLNAQSVSSPSPTILQKICLERAVSVAKRCCCKVSPPALKCLFLGFFRKQRKYCFSKNMFLQKRDGFLRKIC